MVHPWSSGGLTRQPTLRKPGIGNIAIVLVSVERNFIT
jgi:hypothetical protein